MAAFLLEIFWLLLPAGFANMAPVLFKWVRFLEIPVDLGHTFRGQRLFGQNKTYRGFLFGILASIGIVAIQRHFYDTTSSLAILDYTTLNIYLLGTLLGGGALLGDLIESFFKRQRYIAPGKPWIPFDQTDWVVGALGLLFFYVPISWPHIVGCLIFWGCLHPIVNLIGYALGIKKNKI